MSRAPGAELSRLTRRCLMTQSAYHMSVALPVTLQKPINSLTHSMSTSGFSSTHRVEIIAQKQVGRAQDHKTERWWGQDMNPSSRTLGPVLFTHCLHWCCGTIGALWFGSHSNGILLFVLPYVKSAQIQEIRTAYSYDLRFPGQESPFTGLLGS